MAVLGKIYGPYMAPCPGRHARDGCGDFLGGRDRGLCAAASSVRTSIPSGLVNATLTAPAVKRSHKCANAVAAWAPERNNVCRIVAGTLESGASTG